MNVPFRGLALTLTALVASGWYAASLRASSGAATGTDIPPTASADGGGGPIATPLPAFGYRAREGRRLFAHYCAPCHGAEGRGDGFNAYNLDPGPRDLAEPGFQDTRTDEDLEAVIVSGGRAAGLSTGMPRWGRTLNEREVANLVVYVRLLRLDPSESDG